MRCTPYGSIVVPFALLAISSCTGGRGADGSDGTDCTVSKSGTSTVISCDDGTKATVGDGAAGPAGNKGADGEDGATGTDGVNGADSLVSLTDEPASANCANGGTKVQVGLDNNGDGVLSAQEIDSTRYLCNGASGVSGRSALMLSASEPPGVHCVDGGVVIQNGLDDNGNGTLEPAEVDQTQYICKTACVLRESTVIVQSGAQASLNYTNDQTWDDNTIRAQTDTNSDVVGWLGFDLTSVPDNSVILNSKLMLRHNPVDSNPSGNPTVQILRGTANGFTRTGVTAASMQKGPAVSGDYSIFSLDGWNAFVISLTHDDLATDRSDNYVTLGIDEIGSNGASNVAFFGSVDAATRPYLELELVACDGAP
jgi:hypothetical protein